MQARYTVYPRPSPSPSPSPEPEGPTSPCRHIYRPLKRDEIRLLILNPGAPTDPITCYLEHYAVSKTKPFSALSYAWGAASATSGSDGPTILLGGAAFSVTTNLFSFLRAYRTEHECPVLWIDAICIDQLDLAEHSAQIPLMKRIYEGAEQVLIWLGDATLATGPAIDHMNRIYANWWMPRLDLAGGSPQRALAAVSAEDVTEVLDNQSRHHQLEWEGMQEIFSRPWWTRIWVYQEATSPCRRSPVVLIGPHSIPFEHVLTMNQIIRHAAWRGNSFSKFQNFTSKTSAYMQTYTGLRRRYQETGLSRFLKLADLLPALRNFDATNPRDKLYALIPTSLDEPSCWMFGTIGRLRRCIRALRGP